MADSPQSEPVLTFKLSDVNEFRCSACDQEIRSLGGNGRFIVVGIQDLVETFKLHVEQCHTFHPQTRNKD